MKIKDAPKVKHGKDGSSNVSESTKGIKDADETHIVIKTIDLKNMPNITAEQQARLAAIAAMPDDQIDYSDAPYLPNAVWKKAYPHFHRTKG